MTGVLFPITVISAVLALLPGSISRFDALTVRLICIELRCVGALKLTVNAVLALRSRIAKLHSTFWPSCWQFQLSLLEKPL